MRIEPYIQIQQMYNTQKPGKSQKSSSSSFSDRLQISAQGKDFQTTKSALMNTSDIREELTAPIQAAIANGTYSVSSEEFADKILSKYNETLM